MLFLFKNTKVWCYADFYQTKSRRDIQTAELWLEGFDCNTTEVRIVTDSENANMAPVLSDHYDNGCPLPSEEQIDGLYGGDVDALTEMYRDDIQKVQDILEMPTNASICKNVNPEFNKTDNCTFFETGYDFTGLYYEGEFTSPIYYASYFAETWMLQYVSNLTNWAFNKLTLSQMTDLYNLHIKSLSFGMNPWTSKAYSSQQMAYIVASLYQKVKNGYVAGVNQPTSNNLLLLVSHDTNILYLGTLLNLNWIPLGYGNNVASTAGALIFELYQDQDAGDGEDSFYVKVHYDAASPTQQRNAENLTLDNPLSVATLVIPECGEEYCPWSKFVQAALGAIDFNCIQEPLQSTAKALYYGSDNDDDVVYQNTSIAIFSISASIALFVILFVIGLFVYNKNKGNSGTDKHLYKPLVGESNDGSYKSATVHSKLHNDLKDVEGSNKDSTVKAPASGSNQSLDEL